MGLLGAANAAVMAAEACKHNQQWQGSQKRTEAGYQSVLQRALQEQRISGLRPLTVSIDRNDPLWRGLPPSPWSSFGVARTRFQPAEKHGKAKDQARQVCARHKLARLAPVRERARMTYLQK